MQASQILISSPQDFLHHVQTNHVDKDRFGNRGLLTQRPERFSHTDSIINNVERDFLASHVSPLKITN